MVDETTLRKVLASALPQLTRVASRICASRSDADDLVQETLEMVMTRGLPVHVEKPIAWLITSMHRRFIDHCRRRSRAPIHEPLDDAHDNVVPIAGEEPEWSQIDIEDIRRALQEINATFRQVYELHCFMTLTYEEIANRLNISTVTVGTRLTRARQQLRKVLSKRDGRKRKP